MRKLVSLSKTLLILLSVSLVSCGDLPKFPDWNPVMIIPSQNKAFKCKLIDAENILFQCEKTSIPYNSLNMDQQICSSVKETQDIIGWVKQVKKKWEDSNCKKVMEDEALNYGP